MAVGIPWQVLNNAAGLQNNNTAGSGIAHAVYDAGSIHQQVDGVVKAFDQPTGSDQVSLSLMARLQNDPASTGVTGYGLSWDRLASGVNGLTFTAWNAGAATVLATFTNSIPTPTTQKLSFLASGPNLTAKINDQVVVDGIGRTVAVTDSGIVTGTYAGIHCFRTATYSNAFWDSWAVFAIPAPPPSTTRSVLTRPFQGGDNTSVRCAPWNMPRGDACTFNTSSGAFGNGQMFSNSAFGISAANGFGVMVGGAGYPLVNVNSGEGHYSVYRSDGTTADEYFAGVASGETVTTGSGGNHVVTNVKGLGVGVGFDVATELSQLGGCLRKADFDSGTVPHALQIAVGGSFLATFWVWPAIFGDSYRGSNTGFVPYGALVAIPTSAVIPAGCNAVETMIWTALRNYGAYVADGQGDSGSQTAGFMSLRAEAAAQSYINTWRDSAQGLAIGQQVRWVTNNTTDNGVTNLGGPGTRLAGFAPLV